METKAYIKLIKIKKTKREIEDEIKANPEKVNKENIIKCHYALSYRINMNHNGGLPLSEDWTLRTKEISRTIVEKLRLNGKRIQIKNPNSYDVKAGLGQLTKNEFNRIRNYLVKEHQDLTFFISDKKSK